MPAFAPCSVSRRSPDARRSGRLRPVLLGVVLLLGGGRLAFANQFAVDRLDDDASAAAQACTLAADDCSLRGAVIAANTQPGIDVIILAGGTYSLTIANPPDTHENAAASGDLDITGDVDILGAGSPLTTIDGGNLDRVFHTDPAGTGTLTVNLSGVTIQHGKTVLIGLVHAEGGAIRNGVSDTMNLNAAGTLTLTDVVVKDSESPTSGGGISNNGTLTITDGVVSGNFAGTVQTTAGGGGIDNEDNGTLTILRTAISGNHAGTSGAGGGVFSGRFTNFNPQPLVSIDSSTISGNTALGGGGIFHDTGNVTIVNSTISGNTSTQTSGTGGAGISDSAGGTAPMVLLNCTVANNTSQSAGGGIQNNGVLTGLETQLANTIVAGNHATSGVDIAGSMLSAGFNLIGDATGVLVDPSSTTTGDIMGVSAANLRLGPLAPNGLAATQTHALLLGSPAIDAGNPFAPDGIGTHCPAQDEVGTFRPIDGDGNGTPRCDIGAFEFRSVPTTPTPGGTGTTPTATPTPTAVTTGVPGSEICDNCVDDDSNGLVDRSEPSCTLPDGGNVGVGGGKRGKALVKCAAVIQKSGAKLESQRLGRLQKCVDTVLACVQLKEADVACLTKAESACNKALAAFSGDEAALIAKITKSCGPPAVDPGDLTALDGLGYGMPGAASPCALVGAVLPTDATTVAACVAKIHTCRAAAALGIQVPRAAGLLALVHHTAGEVPCLPTVEIGGATHLADPTVGKLAVKCEVAVKKAGAKLVATEVKGLQKCANTVFTCVQAKPTEAKCLPKARAGCDKTFVQLASPNTGLGGKLLAAVLKACQVSGLGLADVLDDTGLGVASLETACSAVGAPGIQSSITNLGLCLTAYHKCRAAQLLEGEIPRLKELLVLGGHSALP